MKPNPGSDKAIKRGCKCPVLDNGHGNKELGRIRGFWISGDCPIHGKLDISSDILRGMWAGSDDNDKGKDGQNE